MLSFSIWLVMILSRDNTSLESVTVQAYSNVEGRASVALETVVVTARCRASGFKLIALSSSEDVVNVTFDADDLMDEGNDSYYIDAQRLSRYVRNIFGPGVSVESFAEPGVRFKFLTENFKKVPVIPVSYITYHPQYMALGKMSLTADSVLVYGSPESLLGIDRVHTNPITLRDVRRDERGITGLSVPPGVRLSEKEVGYHLPVGRFVEIRASVMIASRNVPAGIQFFVSPGMADVVWKCSYPLRSNPKDNSSFYVDYREFEGSITGKCVIRSDVPEGVISCSVYPQVCSCVENVVGR